MTYYSLITVTKHNQDGTINGYWIQDKYGSIEEVSEYAEQTSKLNGNSEVAIVEKLGHTRPEMHYLQNLIKLN